MLMDKAMRDAEDKRKCMERARAAKDAAQKGKALKLDLDDKIAKIKGNAKI